MRDFINSFLTAVGLVLAIPTSLILVSWNALPGDSLYGLKTGLENVAFILTKDTPLASAFSLKFTDRRFGEANILLAQKGSTLGYTLLVAEAQKTKDVIVEKNDTQSASELVAKIDQYEKTIDEKKLVLESQQPINQNPTPFIIPSPTSTPSILKPIVRTPTPQPTIAPRQTPPPSPVPNQQVINDLDKAKEDLEKIKDDIKRKLPPEKSHSPFKEERDVENKSH